MLVPQEIEELFENLRELKAQGETIIFISHKLDEVLSIADSITVLRGGRTVATVDPKDVTSGQLAELMVGSELPTPETRESTVTDEVVLELRDVIQTRGLTRHFTSKEGTVDVQADERFLLQDIGFQVHRGEVVGIAGVEGNGQSELIDVILGMEPVSRGAIRLGGEDIADLHTRQRREAGIGYIPEDRHRRGMIMSSPLWENAMLGHQTKAPFAKGPWIDRRGAKRRTAGDPGDLRRAGARRRRGRLRAVRRQPAEADRRPRAHRRRPGPAGEPPHPRASTSGPRPPCGTTCVTPAPPGWPSSSSPPTWRSSSGCPTACWSCCGAASWPDSTRPR